MRYARMKLCACVVAVIAIAYRLIEIISLPFQFRQYFACILDYGDRLVRNRTYDKLRHCQPALLDLLIDDLSFLIRRSKCISKRSCSVTYNFSSFSFCFIWGLRVLPNEDGDLSAVFGKPNTFLAIPSSHIPIPFIRLSVAVNLRLIGLPCFCFFLPPIIYLLRVLPRHARYITLSEQYKKPDRCPQSGLHSTHCSHVSYYSDYRIFYVSQFATDFLDRLAVF